MLIITLLTSYFVDRKLKATLQEYTTRVGQQAIILTCTPGKIQHGSLSYKVFGSQPLEGVVS